MKILLCIRQDFLSNPAGDTSLVIQTAGYLRRRGIEVEINCGRVRNISGYDAVHLFNLTRITETYEYFRKARQERIPTVLTPIYWDLSKWYRFIGDERALREWEFCASFRQEILSGCNAVYPSSDLERELIGREYGTSLPQTVVYCGIDPKKLLGGTPPETERRDYILCVARICPRKNQLALAWAANQLGVPLLLAGKANQSDYLDRCLAFRNVQYLGLLPFWKLLPLYRNARLHVLCGFVETPGLANLEAAACGCNILSTMEGSAAEYFDDMALYCDPYNEGDILEKLKMGLTRNRQPCLSKYVLENFSLDQCLEPLECSYRTLAR